MVAYLLSDWTRLLLVCMYAREETERARNICMERLILSFFRSKISAKTWHGLLDQYVFLKSYDDRPRFWNLAHIVTTGMIPNKDEGAKLGSAIDVPEYVLLALRILQRRCPRSSQHCLTTVVAAAEWSGMAGRASTSRQAPMSFWCGTSRPTSARWRLPWNMAST